MTSTHASVRCYENFFFIFIYLFIFLKPEIKSKLNSRSITDMHSRTQQRLKRKKTPVSTVECTMFHFGIYRHSWEYTMVCCPLAVTILISYTQTPPPPPRSQSRVVIIQRFDHLPKCGQAFNDSWHVEPGQIFV